MEKDRERWNKKFSEGLFITEPSGSVKQFHTLASGKMALDIAAGMGRNSEFLARHGFEVDALELSDVAIEKLKTIKGVNVIQVDLDNYIPEVNKYDLIICINYLNRKLFPRIIDSLKSGGILIYETLMLGEETAKLNFRRDFLLEKGELLSAFNKLKILEYKEFVTHARDNRSVNKALLVAKK